MVPSTYVPLNNAFRWISLRCRSGRQVSGDSDVMVGELRVQFGGSLWEGGLDRFQVS